MKAPPTDVGLSPVVTGPVELVVSLAPPIDPAMLEELRAYLADFLFVADRGAFVIADRPPEAASLAVTAEHSTAAGFVLVCEAANLDRRFVQVLRNMCVMFSAVHHPVAYVRARMAGVPLGPLPPIDPTAVTERYPPRSKHLRFGHELTIGGDYRGPRYAEISFASALDEPFADEIVAWLRTWANVALGGFSSSEAELESGDCAIFDAVPDLRDPATIEVPVAMFGAPACAWNTFLNLCGRIDAELARVVAVEIE